MNRSLPCLLSLGLLLGVGRCSASNPPAESGYVQLEPASFPEEIKLYTVAADSTFKENDAAQFSVLQSQANTDLFVYTFKAGVRFQEIKYNDTVLWVNGDYSISEPTSMIYKVDTRITIRDLVKSVNYRLLTDDEAQKQPASPPESPAAPGLDRGLASSASFSPSPASTATTASAPAPKPRAAPGRPDISTFVFALQVFMALLLVALTTIVIRLYGLVHGVKLTVDKSDQRSLLA